MALTFTGGSSNSVSHGQNASINTLNTWTALFWFYPTARTSGMRWMDKAARRYIRWASTLGEVRAFQDRSTTSTIYETNNAGITINKWWFLAVTYDKNASSGSIITISVGDMLTEASAKTFATATDGVGNTASDSGNNLYVGGNNSNAGFPGAIAHFSHWNRVLSLAEIRSQQFARRPESGCLIFSEYGFAGTGTQPDYSGNGFSGSVNGATQSDHVPVPYVRRGYFVVPASVTAGPFTQGFTASMGSFSAARVVSVGKHISAAPSAFSGFTAKRTSRTIAATPSSFSAAVSKRTGKPISASMGSFSGSLAASIAYVISIAASMGSFAGSATRRTAKGIAAFIGNFSGATTKRTAHSFSASMGSFAATLGRIKTFLASFTASMGAFSVAISRSTRKSLTAAISSFAASATKRTSKTMAASMGSFSASITAIKTFLLNLTASMGSFSAAITRGTKKTIAAAPAAWAAMVTKRTARSLAASMSTFSGAVAKRTGKAMTAAMGSFAATVAALKSFGAVFTASMGQFSASISKSTSKGISASMGAFSAIAGKLQTASIAASMASFAGALVTRFLAAPGTPSFIRFIFRLTPLKRLWRLEPMRRIFTIKGAGMIQAEKDPASDEDFQFDWQDEISTDSITSSTWSIQAGLTKESDDATSFTSTTSTVRLSGGVSGRIYTCTNTITLAGGQTKVRSMQITVRPE